MWANDYKEDYINAYKLSVRIKRTDKPKVLADISCQIYKFIPMSEKHREAKELWPVDKLNPTNPRFNLYPRKARKQQEREYKNYDPECECCQVTILHLYSNKIIEQNNIYII